MPGKDGTGPVGQGPMTGRGMGYCVKESETGERTYVGGEATHGIRCLRGRGRCRSLSYACDDKAILEKEKNFYLEQLEYIEKKLEKMK